ncbi:MAG: Bug family tripartite tricarboxylate transporter substrate binding protein [Burkholderiales bacterium]
MAVRVIAVCAAFCAAAAASAQTYPDKPVRFVIAFPAGGFSDIVARVVTQKLSERLGQPIIVDNRPGASGNIGADIVAKAAPDGYTLLANAINFVINPSVIKTPFDPIKDFAGVSLIANGPPQVVTVSAASPWRTIKDVIGAAKAQPGKLNFATSGLGSSAHLSTELLKSMTGIDVVQVPFKGAALALSSVVSGDVAVVFPNLPVVIPQLKAGRLRALAVTSLKRSPALPDVPTMAESGLPGFDSENFLGLLAPARTPNAIIRKLSGELAQIAKQPDVIERYATFGMQAVGSTPEEMNRFTRSQLEKYSKVLKAAGYTPQ